MARLLDFFKKDPFSKRLEKIKNGDSHDREKLIEEYIPFIIKTVSKVTNRYIESENSEEYSIGLEAFNEAIEKYDAAKGNFLSFASLVIESRTLDYLRKMQKHSRTIPISQFGEEEEQQQVLNRSITEDFTEELEIKDEIRLFEEMLKDFEITFQDLIESAPKHTDTRKNALAVAKHIAENEDLREELLRKKMLPTTKLTEHLQVTQKMLKRSRKFIIAAVLLYSEKFDRLKVYVTTGEGGEESGLQRISNRD
ncbi:MAG: RNA polymerase sigma-I factor [Bacillota bacterium]